MRSYLRHQVAAALRLQEGGPPPSVARLSLANNDLTAEGARAVAAALADGTALRELSLLANHIGDKGTAALATALRRNATLHTLNLVRWRTAGPPSPGQGSPALLARLALP